MQNPLSKKTSGSCLSFNTY